jgi:hypothetical protein
LLHGQIEELGQQTAVIISGGNIDSALLTRIITREFEP